MLVEQDFQFTATKGSVYEKREDTLKRINEVDYYVFSSRLEFTKNTKITGIEEYSIQSAKAYNEFKDAIAIYETDIAMTDKDGIKAGETIATVILDQYNNDWRRFRKAIKDMQKLSQKAIDIVELCYKFYWDSNVGVKYFI